MNKRHIFYSLPIILLLIVVVAGWFATDYIGNKVRQEIIEESQASVLTLSVYVSGNLSDFKGAVKSLAGSPWIAPALLSKKDQDIDNANSVLDRYNSALNASVSYLMDAGGMVVASSNSKDPDSFVGKSYRFRPYFQKAAEGRASDYFALGITSGKRGFYTSYPVQDRSGKVLGVVTIKKDIDEIEIFFRKYPFCFLINPDGIVFLSSSPAMVLKSLWPLDKVARDKFIASQQFGSELPETAFFKKEIADGTEVALEGKNYIVSRRLIDSDGWSIVLLTPTERIGIYKLTGILAMTSLCFLIMIFSGIIYFMGRTKEAFRKSEEDKRLLLDTVEEGIFGVDTMGRVTFVNSAALRMLGFAAEEILGQNIHGLVHHSHKDGSNYPVEDCPIYASDAKAADSHDKDEVFWRKDGSSFSVKYSGRLITKNGKATGKVVTFQDITEQKQAEEALGESEEKFRKISTLAQDAIIMMDSYGTITYWNEAAERIFDYTPDEAIGKDLHVLLAPQKYYQSYIKGLDHFLKTGEGNAIGKTLELLALRKDGTEFPVELSLSAAHLQNGWSAIGILRDITERKELEQQLHTMSLTDELTGLYNRRGFITLSEQQLKIAVRTKKDALLFFVDLDKMKHINDTFGHEEGDNALVEVANIFKEVFRGSDIIGRMGGDEFAILAIDTADGSREVLIDRLHNTLDDHNRPEGRNYKLSLSMGMAHYDPEKPCSLDELIAQADTSMYEEKRNKQH